MRIAKRSRFTLGSRGGNVFARFDSALLCHGTPFATVRNEGAMAVPIANVAQVCKSG